MEDREKQGFLRYLPWALLAIIISGAAIFAALYFGEQKGIEKGRVQAEEGVSQQVKAAYKEGHDTGHDAGYHKGWIKGMEDAKSALMHENLQSFIEGYATGQEDKELEMEEWLEEFYDEVYELCSMAYDEGWDKGYDIGYEHGSTSRVPAQSKVGTVRVGDNVFDVLADPINGKAQWQGKNAGIVDFGNDTTYYGQYANNTVNGFGVYWIYDSKTDGYGLFLGRRMNGIAQGPNIRVNSDGSYFMAVYNDGVIVSNRVDFNADGTVKN